MQKITESRFQMWRAIVSVVHADGHVSPEEVEMVGGYLERLPFTDSQREQLKNELHLEIPIDDILPLITVPADRGQFVYFARLLMWEDGELVQSEKELLDHMNVHVLSQLDMDSLMREIKKYELQDVSERPSGLRGVFERFMKMFELD